MQRSEWGAIIGLVLFAWALRVIGIAWGNPATLPYSTSFAPYQMLHDQVPTHPDEFLFVALPYKMAVTQRLKPDFYENPSFTLLLNYVTTRLTGAERGVKASDRTTGNDRHYAPFSVYVVGRVYSAVGALLAVVAVYAVVRRLAGRWGALSAGLLMAVAFPTVQHAHYATTSNLAGGFVALALWASTHALTRQHHKTRWFFGASVCVGLATATRYNAAIVAIVLVMLGLWWLKQGITRQHIRRIAWGIGGALGAFLVAMPYVILDLEKVIQDIRYISSQYLSAETATTYSPWVGLSMEWHYLLVFGIGAPAAVALMVGIWHARQSVMGGVLVLYSVAYSLLILRTVRPNGADQLLLPILPAVVMLVGLGSAWILSRLPNWARSVAVVGMILIPMSLSLSFLQEITRPDHRVQMTWWLTEHLPKGATVRLIGAYQVILDPQDYVIEQIYASADAVDYSALPPTDYLIISDSIYHSRLRAGMTNAPIQVPQGATLVAQILRVPKPGSDWELHTASYWHNPSLWVYCLNEVACTRMKATQ